MLQEKALQSIVRKKEDESFQKMPSGNRTQVCSPTFYQCATLHPNFENFFEYEGAFFTASKTHYQSNLEIPILNLKSKRRVAASKSNE